MPNAAIFNELYYLCFHYGFQVIELRKARGKICGAIFYLVALAADAVAVIHAEKNPVQRCYNWGILALFFNPALRCERKERRWP